MKYLVTAAFALSLCACTHMEKVGATQADYDRDDFDCTHLIRMSTSGSLIQDAIEKVQCMKNKGWTVVRN
jgi:hypothetical protein